MDKGTRGWPPKCSNEEERKKSAHYSCLYMFVWILRLFLSLAVFILIWKYLAQCSSVLFRLKNVSSSIDASSILFIEHFCANVRLEYGVVVVFFYVFSALFPLLWWYHAHSQFQITVCRNNVRSIRNIHRIKRKIEEK